MGETDYLEIDIRKGFVFPPKKKLAFSPEFLSYGLHQKCVLARWWSQQLTTLHYTAAGIRTFKLDIGRAKFCKHINSEKHLFLVSAKTVFDFATLQCFFKSQLANKVPKPKLRSKDRRMTVDISEVP